MTETRDDERGSLTWQGNTLRYHVDENLQLRTPWSARDRSRWERDGWTVTPDSARDDEREALIAEANRVCAPGIDRTGVGYEVGLIRRLADALARKHPEPEPARDDEREALANFLHQRRHPCGLDPVEPDYEFADAILATLAPYRKHP